MYAPKQQGKGLFAFLAGSVVALLSIAAVLFMINRNNERDFRQPETAAERNPRSPERLTPHTAAPTTDLPADRSSDSVPPIETLPRESAETVRNTAPPAKEAETAGWEDSPALPAPLPIEAEAPKSKPKADTASRSKAEPKKTPPPDDFDESKIKPTAEQILNSGNLEKARAAAIREAREQRARERSEQGKRNSTAQTDSGSSKTPAAGNIRPKTQRGSATVQAGAYNDRAAAENQRAKIALLGVQTQVVEVQSNGKTMYRVQTARLDGNRAERVSKTLQENGINTFTRNH